MSNISYIPDDIFTILLEYVHDVGNLVCANGTVQTRIMKNAKFLTCFRLIPAMYMMPNLKKLAIGERTLDVISSSRYIGFDGIPEIKSMGKYYNRFPNTITDLTIDSGRKFMCANNILPCNIKILRVTSIRIESMHNSLEELYVNDIQYDKCVDLPKITHTQMMMGCADIGDKCIEYVGDIALFEWFGCSGNEILERVVVEAISIDDVLYTNCFEILSIESLTYLEFRGFTIYETNISDISPSTKQRTLRFSGCTFECDVPKFDPSTGIICEIVENYTPYVPISVCANVPTDRRLCGYRS